MILTFGGVIPPASVQRGRLKHSWLENEILNKTPETVVALRQGVGWPELQRFSADVEQALVLVKEVESGFSPAKLVDQCTPLMALTESQKNIIRNAVHRAYLAYFDTLRAARGLHDSATDMKEALIALLEEWNKPDATMSGVELQARWVAVLREAERLRTALDALPRGIVLP
jgi:hypothetical protein